MTIDERLEKLTERHEALTQTVEIIAGMQRENEKRFEETDRRISKAVDLIANLTNIVESHQRRLDDLES